MQDDSVIDKNKQPLKKDLAAVYQRLFGRVAVRASGSLNMTTAHSTPQGVTNRYCCSLHRRDGYTYPESAGVSAPSLKRGGFHA